LYRSDWNFIDHIQACLACGQDDENSAALFVKDNAAAPQSTMRPTGWPRTAAIRAATATYPSNQAVTSYGDITHEGQPFDPKQLEPFHATGIPIKYFLFEFNNLYIYTNGLA